MAGVKNENVCCGHWGEYTKPEKELESALANMIAQRRRDLQQYTTAIQGYGISKNGESNGGGADDGSRKSIFKWLAKKAQTETLMAM